MRCCPTCTHPSGPLSVTAELWEFSLQLQCVPNRFGAAPTREVESVHIGSCIQCRDGELRFSVETKASPVPSVSPCPTDFKRCEQNQFDLKAKFNGENCLWFKFCDFKFSRISLSRRKTSRTNKNGGSRFQTVLADFFMPNSFFSQHAFSSAFDVFILCEFRLSECPSTVKNGYFSVPCRFERLQTWNSPQEEGDFILRLANPQRPWLLNCPLISVS